MKTLTPLKAVRAKCLDCCAGSYYEVRLCPCNDCSLWIYRFGRNPKRKGIGNPDFNKSSNVSSDKTKVNSASNLSQ